MLRSERHAKIKQNFSFSSCNKCFLLNEKFHHWTLWRSFLVSPWSFGRNSFRFPKFNLINKWNNLLQISWMSLSSFKPELCRKCSAYTLPRDAWKLWSYNFNEFSNFPILFEHRRQTRIKVAQLLLYLHASTDFYAEIEERSKKRFKVGVGIKAGVVTMKSLPPLEWLLSRVLEICLWNALYLGARGNFSLCRGDFFLLFICFMLLH